MNTESCTVNKQPWMSRESAASPDGSKVEHVSVLLWQQWILAHLHSKIITLSLRDMFIFLWLGGCPGAGGHRVQGEVEGTELVQPREKISLSLAVLHYLK